MRYNYSCRCTPFALSLFLGAVLLLFSATAVMAAMDQDPLTAAQRSWLDAHKGQLTLAFEPDWPPASFFNGAGKVQGIIPEYVSLIEKNWDFSSSGLVMTPGPIFFGLGTMVSWT